MYFSEPLAVDFTVTPVGGNKCITSTYWIIHSTDLFKNADLFMNKTSDSHWIIHSIYYLFTIFNSFHKQHSIDT